MSSPNKIGQRLVAESFVVVAIALWWLSSAQFPPNVFPNPIQVFWELVRLSTDAEFWGHAAATGIRVLLAVVLSTVLGSALGILPRYFPWLGGIVDDVLVPFFTSFPAIVWAILGTVWFGLTGTAILIVQTLIIFPFCLVNVTEGGKEIGREEIEMGRSFGRRPWSIFWRIELPLLAPFIISGARISYGVCWKISLIAELFGGRSGLGYMMQWARDFGSVDSIIAICLAIVFFVSIGDALVLRPLTQLFQPKTEAGSRSKKGHQSPELLVTPTVGRG
ncbi:MULTISPECIES: ABC transporter permease [unclassified Beijerinckia]|uniref:ABC transporter permease n=1 Tax=unclassified Beijerinckia TaxID=2638183 RepID=UPI000896E528|nr:MULTISPECIES: ABC transporter permease [unclassified Beijerinckia]MDH7796927.1 NitT/TauT family transport system permease protein [Beijerinckia sp. GAS462]SEC65419.1 NitT/TauT family transport system permease protein/sulfonate transport system permease protein [Beijerinckia sp. 28-YEA-48]